MAIKSCTSHERDHKEKNRKLPTSLFSWGFFCHKVILTKPSSMSAHECLSISIMMLLA